ncbi:hypothetical protein SDC9_37502 [bioreactor metagenome]|uniref:Uncharacterized protein n=1 Tax=bioreactor metagenome TaxID=1076179 RepID=A0A644VJ59_9ZZZZ
MLNYSKKLDRKIFILGLLIFTVFLLATTTQTDFAATNPINNTTNGGISGVLNSSSPGDIIELDEGIYTGNNNTNMTINKNITIQGKTKDKVILDAQGLSRIFTIANNQNVTFINITFINGYHNTMGAAIYGLDVNVKIINCMFTNNSANYGGAVRLLSANVSMSNSNFINNYGFDGASAYFNRCNSTIIECNFINNTASSIAGGISINRGFMNIYNCNFTNNTATLEGGGIINYLANTIINNTIITGNIASNYGGGIVNDGYLTIIDSYIVGNIADKGGGITNLRDLTVISSSINNNTANNNGGAIFSTTINNSSNSSTVIVSGSDLSGNSAGGDGGAVSSSTGDGSSGDSIVIIDDSTINDNNAGNDGGALSSNTGENSTGNSIIIVIDSDIENNTAGNNGDTASATTGDGSSGDSEIDIIGDSTIINNNPDKDDDGIYTSTGEDSTGSSEINIDDGVIKKLSSNSTIIVSNTVVGKTVVIRGVAIDENGNPLANIQLTININGVDYNVTTNALGEWSLNYTPSSPGTITVTVDLNENNKYYAFTNTTNFNVAKANTRSTIVISNATSGKSTIIRGVLVDENGNTIANAPINVVIGGKSNNLVTGADGSWSLSYTPAQAGKFIAKVYYNGNSNYVASTSSLNYTVAQGTSAPKKTDIRLLKKKSSKVFRHGKRVVMKWFTYKNYGATGSKNITTKVIIKNLKYKLWKVYNKKLSYKYGNNKIKFKLNLKSGEKFKLKLKVYKPIKQK